MSLAQLNAKIFKNRAAIIAALVLLLAIFLGTKNSSLIIEKCSLIKNISEKSACLEKMIATYAAEGKVTNSFRVLMRAQENDLNIALDCHGYAHVIGESAAQAFLKNHSIEISSLSHLCSYGFYHGFMDSILLATGDYEEAQEFCDYTNAELRKKGLTGGLYACYHGFGHGLMDGSDPRLWGNPNAMASPALAVCARVAETPFLHSRCATGIFNALEILASDKKYKLEESIGKDPFSICRGQTLLYREPCYTNMIIAVLRLTENNIPQALDYILNNISYPNDETTIGGTVMEHALAALFAEYVRLHGKDVDYAGRGIALCRSLSLPKSQFCLKGITEGHMKYGTAGKEYIRATAFCEIPLLGNSERDICFKEIFDSIETQYDYDTIKKICDLVEEQYARQYCKKTT